MCTADFAEWTSIGTYFQRDTAGWWNSPQGITISRNDMPRWTREDYEAYQNRHSPSHSQPQPSVCHDTLGKAQGKESHSGRVQVRIASYRRRLLDPDNLAGGCKFYLDCCRYANLIPDDRPQDIELIVTQQKVKHRTDERTEIEIYGTT